MSKLIGKTEQESIEFWKKLSNQIEDALAIDALIALFEGEIKLLKAAQSKLQSPQSDNPFAKKKPNLCNLAKVKLWRWA